MATLWTLVSGSLEEFHEKEKDYAPNIHPSLDSEHEKLPHVGDPGGSAEQTLQRIVGLDCGGTKHTYAHDMMTCMS